jgi:hypothetical protein
MFPNVSMIGNSAARLLQILTFGFYGKKAVKGAACGA